MCSSFFGIQEIKYLIVDPCFNFPSCYFEIMITIGRVWHTHDDEDLNLYSKRFRYFQNSLIYIEFMQYVPLFSVSIYPCGLEDAMYEMSRYEILGFITMKSTDKYSLYLDSERERTCLEGVNTTNLLHRERDLLG